jgi:hypothetical protein
VSYVSDDGGHFGSFDDGDGDGNLNVLFLPLATLFGIVLGIIIRDSQLQNVYYGEGGFPPPSGGFPPPSGGFPPPSGGFPPPSGFGGYSPMSSRQPFDGRPSRSPYDMYRDDYY